MAEKNPYYIDHNDCYFLNSTQLYNAKVNNNFLTSIFSNLYLNRGYNASLTVPPGRITQLQAGNLPYSDKETGMDSKELGKKVNFLLTAIESSEEARDIFEKSYFSEAIGFLCKGSVSTNDNAPDCWQYYTHTPNCDAQISNMLPFNAATRFYRDTNSLPIGINYTKLIDIIVTKDEKGNYTINKFSAFKNQKIVEQIKQAIGQQLVDFKKTARFKACFTNNHLKNKDFDESYL